MPPIHDAESLARKLVVDGGFTFPFTPTKGWMVGGAGYEKPVILEMPPSTATPEQVEKLVKVIAPLLDRLPWGIFLGGWLEYDLINDRQFYYVEFSEHFITKTRAWSVAKDHKQTAVYDCVNKQVVRVVDMFPAV